MNKADCAWCYNRIMSSSQTTTRLDIKRAQLRKAAFEALYGRFAWAYDWVSRTFFMGQWRVWQHAAIPYIRGKHVLEVGMGTGNLQIDLRRAGYEVWGVDLSPHMLRQAVRKARRRKMPPFRAGRARAQALPFPASQFDSVVSTFPSDYIIEPATLREIGRVLRPEGRLIVVPSGWLQPRGASSRVFETIARLVYGDNKGGTNAPAPTNKAVDKAIPENLGWVKALESRIVEAGFSVAVHVASNAGGSALVVVADKAGDNKMR